MINFWAYENVGKYLLFMNIWFFDKFLSLSFFVVDLCSVVLTVIIYADLKPSGWLSLRVDNQSRTLLLEAFLLPSQCLSFDQKTSDKKYGDHQERLKAIYWVFQIIMSIKSSKTFNRLFAVPIHFSSKMEYFNLHFF